MPREPVGLPKLTTIEALRRETRVGRETWQSLVDDGHLRAVRLRPDGWLYVFVEDVERLLERLGPEGPETPTQQH